MLNGAKDRWRYNIYWPDHPMFSGFTLAVTSTGHETVYGFIFYFREHPEARPPVFLVQNALETDNDE